MPAPYTLATNVTDFVDMFSWMNGITSGTYIHFGMLLLVAVFSIVFILNSGKQTEVAFAIAAWITCIVSIFLAMLEGSFGYLIPGSYVAVTVTIAAISVILLYVNR